ncbi:MAG: cell division FtsK/SpoIIIE [Candidatus Magnetoglobus multicellularis str. Araruama]|uniref:Cell division FtsK/SpoIIIE n=1 Tax=Candidatus Magnetoglobus multicellularis str. Araruama TaxID=890399 RepID=A0A1V1PBV9_9BACT|nr:MAG: cell division FtsK/SpoIIIE [Candidatus Magnetoglobus multicellularis str. Araruama]
MHNLNVSEIHLCQRCSRLLAYHLSGEKQVWRIGLKRSESLPGKFFHDKIVQPLHKKLASTRTRLFKAVNTICQATDHNFKIRFLEILESNFFLDFMQKHSQSLDTADLLNIGKAFEQWSAFLSEFLLPIIQNMGDQFSLSEIFYLPEQLISQTYNPESGKSLTISGKYDAILFDTFHKEIVILECKGRDRDRSDEDITQVGLYAWLIEQKTGILPRGEILYLTGTDQRYTISPTKMRDIVNQLPHMFDHTIQILDAHTNQKPIHLPRSADAQLCTECPFASHCDTEYGDVSEKTKNTDNASNNTDDKSRNTDDASTHTDGESKGIDTIINLFNMLKTPVFDAGSICGPRFIRYKIKPDHSKSVTVAKITKRAQDLQIAMNLAQPPLMQSQAGYISIDIPRKVRQPLTLGEVMRVAEDTRPNSKVAFPIGMAIDGTIVWINLNDPATPSILVGGTSGSGKSVLLRSILIAMAINAKPEELQLTLIDPKHVSFLDLSDIPHVDDGIIVDNAIAIDKLGQLVDEMECRYAAFKADQVFDINGYQEKGHQIAHHVVIIDEYADLIIDKQTKTDLETAIQRLGQKGRAAGIHLILATQRPDARVVTPLVKANLQLKVALKVTTVSNSNIIIDQPGAECLIGKGDMLIAGSMPVKRLQGPIPSKTDIDKLK